jgi:hypothetical protein
MDDNINNKTVRKSTFFWTGFSSVLSIIIERRDAHM